jgi:MFS family permease
MFQHIFIQLKTLYRQKAIRTALKITLMVVLCMVLYWQLTMGLERLPWDELLHFWQDKFSTTHLLPILIVIALMPLNWALETQKWVNLMRPIEKVSFAKAFSAVLAGLTVSMFTPNRMGEYGGRMLMVSLENRIRSVFATLVGSMSQWLVLVGGGLIGLFILLITRAVPAGFQFYAWTVLVLGMGILGFVGFCYFRLAWFTERAMQWRLTRKWAHQLPKNLFQHYRLQELMQALKLSGLRYLVYSLQYFCLLACFGFEMSWIESFSAILFVFLLQTGLPIPPSAGLLARGSIAVWVFSWFAVDAAYPLIALQSAVLASTFVLWLINVLLPATVGGLFILKTIHSSSAEEPSLVVSTENAHVQEVAKPG